MKRLNSITLRSLAAAALVALLAGIAPAAWAADAYPSKPIRLLVPFGPGGIGDMTGRIVAEKLSEKLGQRVVVENRPSAGMTVAADLALKAPADGYTIFHAGNGAAISKSLFKSLSYDVQKDFTQLSTLATYDLVMCVDAGSRYTSLSQLIRIAKANPGKLNLGTISIGSTQHLSAELFKSIADIDVVIVPYKSTPDLLVALRSGSRRRRLRMGTGNPAANPGQGDQAFGDRLAEALRGAARCPDHQGGRPARLPGVGLERLQHEGRYSEG